MAESEPGNQPGEESLIDQMQAIKTKNAADLIAVREKYDETIQSSEVEFQKRWEDMTKGLLGIDQKGRIWGTAVSVSKGGSHLV